MTEVIHTLYTNLSTEFVDKTVQKPCEITLPYPPSMNSYKKPGRITRTKTGKYYQARVNTEATKRFYWEVACRIRGEKAVQGLKSFGSATISVSVDLFPPDARKRDLDNILKVLLDSLQKGELFDDDYQIASLLVTRCAIVPEGKVIVRVSEYAHQRS